METPVIEITNLTVGYDKKPVLWNINLSLPKGVLVGIIGPNGAGKSTLIKTIMNLVSPQSGYVKLFGKDLREVRNKISYVPQRESVDWDFPASVFDIVLMGRYAKIGLFKKANEQDKKIAHEALEMVGMLPFKNRQIAQLSGGQQQRVFLARALAQKADLYFMDEPFVGVDAATEQSIVDLLRLMRQEGKTVIVVHHDLISARKYFDWAVLINKRLVHAGPTETTMTKEKLFETYGGKLEFI